MTNYGKALDLLDRDIARKHYTFGDTGYISLDLGGSYVGYISPRDIYVDVAQNGIHAGHGDIDLDRMMVTDASNRSYYDRPIKKWENTEVKCVSERHHIL